jgi:hypothetical protein
MKICNEDVGCNLSGNKNMGTCCSNARFTSMGMWCSNVRKKCAQMGHAILNMGMCYHQVEHVSRFIGTHFTCMLPHVNTCSQMPCGCQICDVLLPCQQGAINNGTC